LSATQQSETQTTIAVTQAASRESQHYAWYVLVLLTLSLVLSYVDRFLPSLLIQPIKSDLGLSDLQVGLLLGPAFGLFYVLAGLPIGWMADRFNRRTLLAAGITTWCCMTAAAGLARSFVPLFVTRLGVGLGEATVAPCSVSLISDYFPRSQRPRAVSVFMSGTFIGAGAAFLFGGMVVHQIALLPTVAVPLLGELHPWQTTFLAIGLPGLLLALAMFTIREPHRREQISHGLRPDAHGRASLPEAIRFITARWTAFGAIFIGSAGCVTLGSLAFWNVALFERTWGWGVRDVGFATGLLYWIGGPVGTVLGVWLTHRWIAAHRKDATLRALLTGLLIAVPGFAAYPVMPSAELAVAALFFAFVGQATAAAAGPASLILLAPGQIRAQATAIYYFIISISGQLIGPPPVGWMTDVFGDPAMLRYAMTIEALAVGIPAVLLVAAGLASYRRRVVEVEQLIDPLGRGASHV
jgi:MFS family permease